MPISTVDILAQSIRKGDATSAHTFDLAGVLHSAGMAVRIYCNDPPGPIPADMRSITRTTQPSDYSPTADLTILQYSMWFPLAERFREVPGVAVFWYHGVTPPELWGTDTERDFLQRAQAGTELAWHGHLAVTDSPFTAQELHSHSGYPLERIRTVPLGLDTAAFQQKPSPSVLHALRKKWRLEGKRVLLFAGRVAGNKRIDLLTAALACLTEAYPDLHLLIVGDTRGTATFRELTTRLRAQAERLGLGSRVTFTGRVASTVPYYHLAEMYVSASQHEGFGVPLAEAMAAGTPVIAGASGAVPWVLNAGGSEAEAAGLLFSPGDVDMLARQIVRVLEEPGLRSALIERGYRRVGFFGREQFRQGATGVLSEAEDLARQGPPPAAVRPTNPLYDQADVALRNYRVRSGVPILGPLIEWIRRNSTSHVKEAYLDRVIERQVLYNRLLADEIRELQAEIERLRAQQSGTGKPDDTAQANLDSGG